MPDETTPDMVRPYEPDAPTWVRPWTLAPSAHSITGAPMPDETTTVPPALTAEEWERGYVDLGGQWDLGSFGVDRGALYVSLDTQGDSGTVDRSFSADQSAALMALANAALPDGDPRKLTARAVDDLRYAWRVVAMDSRAADVAERLRALADTIAALLPPEG